MPVNSLLPRPLKRTLGNKRVRGYLLMEIMIGSVLVAGALATTLTLVADAQDQDTFAARDFVAAQLAEQGLEISRAEALTTPTTLTGLVDATNGTLSVATGLQGTYTRTRTITSGTDTVSTSNDIKYKDIVVTVSYVTRSGTRTLKAATRVYERSYTAIGGGGT